MTQSDFEVIVFGKEEGDERYLVEMFEYGDKEAGVVVVEPEHIIDQTRWSTIHCSVVYHHPSDSYFQGTWMTGSTEMQECDLDLEIEVVYPHVVTKTIFKGTPQET